MKIFQKNKSIYLCDKPAKIILKEFPKSLNIGAIITELPKFNGQEDDFDLKWFDDQGYVDYCTNILSLCCEIIDSAFIVISFNKRFSELFPETINEWKRIPFEMSMGIDNEEEYKDGEFAINDWIVQPYLNFQDQILFLYTKNLQMNSFALTISKTKESKINKLPPALIKGLIKQSKGIVFDLFMKDGIVGKVCEECDIPFIGIEENIPMFEQAIKEG